LQAINAKTGKMIITLFQNLKVLKKHPNVFIS
jgi:hypothetical protein